MNRITFTKRRAVWIGAFGALFLQVSAHAALCTPSDSGGTTQATIMTTVNPANNASSTACRVNGLPGVGSDLPGYIQVPGLAFRKVAMNAGSTQVGWLYDRVYCLGSAGACSTPKTYIFATRVEMIGTASPLSCPLWNGAAAGCFEINDIFRSTLTGTGTNGVQSGYWMGASSGSAPESPVAIKYLYLTGRTLSGLNQSPFSRNNGKIAFRTDANFVDPDGTNAPWSPWLLHKQLCPNGISSDFTTATSPARFAVRWRQGGEEGQSQTYYEQAGYACIP